MRLRSKLFLLSRSFIHYRIIIYMIERVRVKRQWCQSVAPHLRTSNWWLGCLIFRWRIGRGFTIIDQWSKTKEFYSTLSMVLWYIDLFIFIPDPLKRCTHHGSTWCLSVGSQQLWYYQSVGCAFYWTLNWCLFLPAHKELTCNLVELMVSRAIKVSTDIESLTSMRNSFFKFVTPVRTWAVFPCCPECSIFPRQQHWLLLLTNQQCRVRRYPDPFLLHLWQPSLGQEDFWSKVLMGI